MPTTPISDPVDESSREDAVIDTAAFAMHKARRLGFARGDPISAIYDGRAKRQARRLLLAAAMHLYGVNALEERKILGNISRIDLAGAYDHETMAELCDGIEDAAREIARDNRERMGDAP